MDLNKEMKEIGRMPYDFTWDSKGISMSSDIKSIPVNELSKRKIGRIILQHLHEQSNQQQIYC